MDDEVVEEAEPLGLEQYTENSPSGNVLQRAACKTAEVWKTVQRLKDVSLMGKILCNDEGRDVYQYSHVCVRCWRLHKITFDKSRKAWKTWGGEGGVVADAEAGDVASAADEGGAVTEGSARVEEEKCGDTESEPEEETLGTVEEPVLSQSVIDTAFDTQF